MSNTPFLNRQALYLRPDPARVVVRPFKPATEPRDFNPTDKTRANHIVDRVLSLDAESVAMHLAEVLENFQGRHRNLLDTFEARAVEMEEALVEHVSFSKEQRRLVGTLRRRDDRPQQIGRGAHAAAFLRAADHPSSVACAAPESMASAARASPREPDARAGDEQRRAGVEQHHVARRPLAPSRTPRTIAGVLRGVAPFRSRGRRLRHAEVRRDARRRC